MERCDATRLTASGRLWACVDPVGHPGPHYMRVVLQPDEFEVEAQKMVGDG